MNLDAGLAGESTADLNHDGLADLVVGSQDRVAVMMNTGSGFGAPTYLDDNLPPDKMVANQSSPESTPAMSLPG
jgi:N-methylhydantoinase B/oxoprolinase/acetone carboxylase alpha subunit